MFLFDNRRAEKEKELAAREAAKFISNHYVVGLGTGSTAAYAINEIGKMIKNGLQIMVVPTSEKTKKLAKSLGMNLIEIGDVDSIDITIDGADEFDEDLNLIKGGGGALFKEKLVASITKMEIIIADSSKKVGALGKFKLPIEVVPVATRYVLNQLNLINGFGKIRNVAGSFFITDQGNYIIDADFGLISDPVLLSDKLNNIEGIVEHGLFINLASRVIMGMLDSTLTFKMQ